MTNDEGLKPEGAPERSPKAGVGAPSGVDENGRKRFSVQRKMAIVARLLRGEPLELVARETNVSIARLSEWRERALAGAAGALKERERDDRDDEIARLKSKVGEITMDNELLYAKIEALVLCTYSTQGLPPSHTRPELCGRLGDEVDQAAW